MVKMVVQNISGEIGSLENNNHAGQEVMKLYIVSFFL